VLCGPRHLFQLHFINAGTQYTRIPPPRTLSPATLILTLPAHCVHQELPLDRPETAVSSHFPVQLRMRCVFTISPALTKLNRVSLAIPPALTKLNRVSSPNPPALCETQPGVFSDPPTSVLPKACDADSLKTLARVWSISISITDTRVSLVRFVPRAFKPRGVPHPCLAHVGSGGATHPAQLRVG
jgi:hypothetical protein